MLSTEKPGPVRLYLLLCTGQHLDADAEVSLLTVGLRCQTDHLRSYDQGCKEAMSCTQHGFSSYLFESIA